MNSNGYPETRLFREGEEPKVFREDLEDALVEYDLHSGTALAWDQPGEAVGEMGVPINDFQFIWEYDIETWLMNFVPLPVGSYPTRFIMDLVSRADGLASLSVALDVKGVFLFWDESEDGGRLLVSASRDKKVLVQVELGVNLLEYISLACNELSIYPTVMEKAGRKELPFDNGFETRLTIPEPGQAAEQGEMNWHAFAPPTGRLDYPVLPNPFSAAAEERAEAMARILYPKDSRQKRRGQKRPPVEDELFGGQTLEAGAIPEGDIPF